MELINLSASIVIFFTSIYMLFVHYGNSRSQLEKYLNKLEYFLVKIGLIFMAMGTVWVMTHIEKVITSQAILNVGLAFFMFWNSIRLKRMFISKKERNIEVENLNISAKKVDPKGEEYPDEPS